MKTEWLNQSDAKDKMGKVYSGAPAARRVAKRSTIAIGREPHACIEIENHATLFMVNMASSKDRGACAPIDDDAAQHGGHTRATTKSRSLG